MEALDNKLTHHLRGSSSFINFDEPPRRILDLGCGTGTWIVEAAKQWPKCEFVGFDLVNVQVPLELLDPSIAQRITWVHGNFLTTRLPFDDDEFDHVHVRFIAQGVPENKWGTLLEEINRVLEPGGSIEQIEDDVIFPQLPRWFTSALRSRSRHHSTASITQEKTTGPSPAAQRPNTPSHDHALLESLLQAVFEHQFINTTPTAVLPSYFITSFRQVTIGPVITFPMPQLAPLLPLPTQVITSYVLEPVSDSLEKRISTVSPSARPLSVSFSSGSTGSSNLSTFTQSTSSATTKRPRTASASLSSPWKSTSSVSSTGIEPLSTCSTPGPPLPPPPELPQPLMYQRSEKAAVGTRESLFPLDRLNTLNERSLAMHLYRSFQTVLACQESMWEELVDRLRNRKHELAPFGWEDDEELEELQNRKRFEKLIERFRSDMHMRISMWSSLTGLGWPVPTREALSKAELIEEERIRESMQKAFQHVTNEEVQTPCRSVRVLIGYKSV